MSTVQDVFIQFFPRCQDSYTTSMQQGKAALDIMRCRTAALGGHVCECEECGHTKVYYNS